MRGRPPIWFAAADQRPRVHLVLRDLDGSAVQHQDAAGHPLPQALEYHCSTDIMLALQALDSEELREIIVILVESIRQLTHPYATPTR